MPADSCPAVLMIADISGYTRFVRVHGVSIAHAQQIISELLESVMDVIKPPLRISKIEGDAVFFYAADSTNRLNQKQLTEAASAQVIDYFRAFYNKLVEQRSLDL